MKINLTKIWKISKSGIKLLIIFLSLVFLFFEVYTIILFHIEGNSSLPENFGNFNRVRALLKDDGKSEKFSFAIVGDTKGRGTFEKIVKKLRNEPLSFMVLLGDCVPKGTSSYHNYLRVEFAEELRTPFPVFYVVGNHDVDRKEFPISQFEKAYGPTNFSFDFKGCLFIILRILDKPYSTEESLEFLKSILQTFHNNYRMIFVFMHIPPPVSSDFHVRSFMNSEKFIRLFDKFHVNYVIAGDYHGYARVKVKDTVYIVTGGGGAHLKGGKFGVFHHAIVIKVAPDLISERILLVNRDEQFEDTMEMWAFAGCYPWLKKNLFLAIVLNSGILGLWILVFYKLLRNKWKFRSN